MTPRNIIGPEIRRRRIQLELSQPQLAARCIQWGWDLSRESLAKIESQIRWVSDFELVCLSNALGVKPADLLPSGPKSTKLLKEYFSRLFPYTD